MEIEALYEIFLGCGKVSTDSRSIKGGELFFALKGENFDGNAYALKALEAGASYAVVDKGNNIPNDKFIHVEDTLDALQKLARRHREELSARNRNFTVLGLTGTNGKTTTKELIRSVLSTKYKVVATQGNLNNSIGVPLTLLGIPFGTEIAVVEMGASHPGDIKELVEVALPDFGLITCVGKGHLLGFGDFDGVKAAKGEMYDFLESNGGVGFVNEDDSDIVGMAALRPRMTTITYGFSRQQACILPLSSSCPFLSMSIGEGADAVTVNSHLVGSYNAVNVLAAVAVGSHFGIASKDAAAAVSGYVPANNRSQMLKTSRNTLIVDAYNANPLSMNVALDSFASIAESFENRVVCLGNMLELGEESVNEHIAIIRKVSTMSFTEVLLVGGEFERAIRAIGGKRNDKLKGELNGELKGELNGELNGELKGELNGELNGELKGVHSAADGGKSCGKMHWFATSDQAAAYLHDNAPSDAIVLIKGSRGSKMENVIPEL